MRPFVIFSAQRSGSTWLRRLLDSHPEIVCMTELFLDAPKSTWNDPNVDVFCRYKTSPNTGGARPFVTWSYMKSLCNYPGEHQSVGFKLIYGHLFHFSELIASLKLNSFKVVHLVRSNHLDKIVSSEIAKETGITHSNRQIEFRPVHLAPAETLHRMRKAQQRLTIARTLLRTLFLEHIEIAYNDLVSYHTDTVREIVAFLGCDYGIHCESDLKKSIKKKQSETIANYNEIKDMLHNTPFSYCIRD